MALVKACKKSDIKEGTGKIVLLEGKPIAIFNVNGKFCAIDNECAHQGGPLGEGYLEGFTVTCPWHGWDYDVSTGISPTFGANVKIYKTEVKDDDVFVDV